MDTENRMTYCDDCGNECREDKLAKSLVEIHHLWERLDPGGVVPAGECKCGALAYLSRFHPVARHENP